MKRTENPLGSICIVGGGTAGWMAASLLSNILHGSNTKITLIESADIATIGVGEATVPSFMAFLKDARLDTKEFMQATAGSIKLGIRFENWYQQNHHFLHPFGKIGRAIDGHEFYQIWLKTLADGNTTRWVDHSPSGIMSEENRFITEMQLAKTPLASYGYAVHLDAAYAARHMREITLARGVQRIESTVESVQTDERKFIQSVQLANGQTIESDFFIDCTGFKGLLISETLKVGYDDWSNYLPCNRAVAVQTENAGDPLAYTIASARAAGWSWKIPLQHRTGNGYVFASDYCSDDEAINTLMSVIKGDLINEPRIIPFVSGMREKIWYKNCLALGLASGFIEPLESTAIHLVYRTLVHFIRNFPDKHFASFLEQQFNCDIARDYMEIRDFVILHYCTTQRGDTAFWRWCQTMEIPESLREKINQFRHRGQLQHHPENLFGADSWYSILEGMNIRPETYHPLVDALDSQKLGQSLKQGANAIRATVMKLPSHGEFLRQHCPAKQS
ncbi:tryptophan 7-halogenase [Cellvibrio sp. KY-GH-1]|uniref:tryptophan halogenase family protein n=1 Tax=Cellvibrio sp. KY-GH-1 TaxID=2303332 RepID=UPI001245FEB7|nr:tryptophan halogenase family protein [Cellvibrio sp. KY-GH-1]QEY17352.1 tryptophan 7-halogenase [Cellvibrio sp. KY-GH-1]